MFKILCVLLIGAFIASDAKPYHPQYIEERIQKREAVQVSGNIIILALITLYILIEMLNIKICHIYTGANNRRI